MQASHRILIGGLVTTVLILAVSIAPSSHLTPTNELPPPNPDLGGAVTTADKSRRAFGHPPPTMPFEQRGAFEVGDSLFNQNWVIAPASTTARDGLGPLFNARSCSSCHGRDGRGQPFDGDTLSDGLLFRLSVPGADPHGGPLGEPIYGGQFNHRAIPGTAAEGRVIVTHTERPGRFGDGTAYTLLEPHYIFADLGYGAMAADTMVSPRVAPQMIGLGLLESVSEADILALADPDDADKDGISGRANMVWDVEQQRRRLGRLGWKANQPSMRQQVAGAFNGDIGITSPIFGAENHTAAQGDQGLDKVLGGGEGEEPELTERALQRVTFYSQHLAVPRQRNPDDPQVQRGWQVFNELNCASCHTPTLRTGGEDVAVSPTLADQTIHPFTDLLLHDMGPELADERPDFEATGQEWRTPPLWGIGLFEAVNGHTRYLHDGRARDLNEAILWHGGEAEASREAYKALDAAGREALLVFLRSL